MSNNNVRKFIGQLLDSPWNFFTEKRENIPAVYFFPSGKENTHNIQSWWGQSASVLQSE